MPDFFIEVFKQSPSLGFAIYCIWMMGRNSDKILDALVVNAKAYAELSIVNKTLTSHIENNTKVIEKCHIKNEAR